MKSPVYTLMSCIAFMLILGCKGPEEEAASETKFIKFAKNNAFLINRVHDKLTYSIQYANKAPASGLPDHGETHKPLSCADLDEAKRITESAINAWTKLLKDAALDGRVIIARDKDGVNPKYLVPPTYVTSPKDAAVQVNFICSTGRSFFRSKPSPQIFLFRQEKSLQSKLEREVLVHEMGHAFGLADLYHEYDFKKAKGSQTTEAVMHTWGLNLSEDDQNGIIFLYQAYVTKTVPFDSCPKGYFVDVKNGCAKNK